MQPIHTIGHFLISLFARVTLG